MSVDHAWHDGPARSVDPLHLRIPRHRSLVEFANVNHTPVPCRHRAGVRRRADRAGGENRRTAGERSARSSGVASRHAVLVGLPGIRVRGGFVVPATPLIKLRVTEGGGGTRLATPSRVRCPARCCARSPPAIPGDWFLGHRNGQYSCRGRASVGERPAAPTATGALARRSDPDRLRRQRAGVNLPLPITAGIGPGLHRYSRMPSAPAGSRCRDG